MGLLGGFLVTIKQHVWVTPYYEEDLRKLADTIGVDHVLFGSDWPHGEGLPDPVHQSRQGVFAAQQAARQGGQGLGLGIGTGRLARAAGGKVDYTRDECGDGDEYE